MTQQATFMAIDLETTGLDDGTDAILEIAVVVLSEDLTELLAREIVLGVHDSAELAAFRDMSDFVRDMHTTSGLLAAIEESQTPSFVIDDWLGDIADAFEWTDDGKPVLLGATIQFDRRFLAANAPAFEGRCHYRQLDVSSCKLLARAACGGKFPKSGAHRAMADIRESIDQARAIASALALTSASGEKALLAAGFGKG
jgi:oligoribonuclease